MPDGYFLSAKTAGAFAINFRSIALPRLRREVETVAFLVACDVIEFDEAYEEVSCLAEKLGANFLPQHIYADLPSWILSELTDATVEAKDRVTRIHENVERAAKSNPVTFYEKLAASCADSERMRWAFASRSPEYRKHLVDERGQR